MVEPAGCWAVARRNIERPVIPSPVVANSKTVSPGGEDWAFRVARKRSFRLIIARGYGVPGASRGEMFTAIVANAR
ncbi:hypothetical protein CCHOA_01775 [Corynebacterium choanae]|uniref:Uncharacterized protein n=1 Tax=Corynebacterium choanae TaxID=1862358 RepID=A0A3G6J4F2_9CORY|nr:hypothetical protein CCHOA_01775 [Corynebacterium choanae]